MTDGIPATSLDDDQLRHELAHLKAKQAEIEAGGAADQQRNHAERTRELEAEFVRRFGTEATDHGGPAPDSSLSTEPRPADDPDAPEEPQPGNFPGAGEPPEAPRD